MEEGKTQLYRSSFQGLSYSLRFSYSKFSYLDYALKNHSNFLDFVMRTKEPLKQELK